MSSQAPATPLALKIALWVAAVGNVLWAIPSPLGLCWGVLFTLGGLGELVSGEATVTANLGAGLTMLLFTGGGLYLLAGYWRAAYWGRPAAPGRRFWWLSAAFNVTVAGVCAVFIVTDAPHPGRGPGVDRADGRPEPRRGPERARRPVPGSGARLRGRRYSSRPARSERSSHVRFFSSSTTLASAWACPRSWRFHAAWTWRTSTFAA